MDPGVAQSFAKLLTQDVVGAAQYEVNHLCWGVDDPQPLGLLLDGDLKEVLVEFLQHLLARCAVVEAPCPSAHTLVEGRHVTDLVLQAEFAEVAPELVQGLRNGVAAREVVPFEECLEDGESQDVLAPPYQWRRPRSPTR